MHVARIRFGTFDYTWSNFGRCFRFVEDDKCNSFLKKKLGKSFSDGVSQAKSAFNRLKAIKQSSKLKNNKLAKYNFQFIKTNRPYGEVQVQKLQLADYPQCDCDPKSANPCGTDDCVNRVLKYECHPSVCAARDRCQNQRFVKRLYPKQAPLYTGERGWGLISKTSIKKGDFANEYVGELIDDQECKRWLQEAQEKNITNFYFLTIDKDSN